jgi:hypothetical protein
LVIDENEQDVRSFGLGCLAWQRDQKAEYEQKEDVLHEGVGLGVFWEEGIQRGLRRDLSWEFLGGAG